MRPALAQFAGWMMLILLTAIVSGGLIATGITGLHWEQTRRNQDERNWQRLKYGLSNRELGLLPLLAQEELTYAQIANHLCISPETVKTHTRHLGAKLGTSGRRNVVAAARREHLLPSPHSDETNREAASSNDQSGLNLGVDTNSTYR